MVVKYSIVDPVSMFDGRITQYYIIAPVIIPTKQCMHHKCPCHVHDGLNCMLCKSVLMLCSSTRKTLILTTFVAVFAKLICRKKSVISMIMIHLYIILIPYPLLKFFYPMMVSPAPSEIWFSTQIISVVASLKMVPPRKWLLVPSLPKTDRIRPDVFTTNFSVDTKYLSF